MWSLIMHDNLIRAKYRGGKQRPRGRSTSAVLHALRFWSHLQRVAFNC